MIRVSAFRSLPPMIQGYVRDITVRWALEEAGLDYEMHLIDFSDLKSESYRKLHPFGQVPTYEEDGLVLFESGAIVLHIAEKSNYIMPTDFKSQARMKSWMFAAMNTIDPVIKNFEHIEYFHPDEEWAKLRRPAVVEVLKTRLSELANFLTDREFLEDHFSAADIMMTMVLRNLGSSDVFTQNLTLVNYVKRCESRVAFQTALSKHMATYS